MTREERFIKDICEVFPDRCNIFKGEIVGCMGWIDEDEIDDLRAASSISSEEYVHKYELFVQRVERELATLKEAQKLEREDIYKIYKYVNDEYKDSVISSILDLHRRDENDNLPKGLSEQEFKRFWEIGDKYLDDCSE